MPLEFLKRRSGDADKAASAQPQPAMSSGLPEEVVAQDFQLKLYYAGKSTEGVRMRAGPQAMAELPRMLEGLTRHAVEVVEPLPLEFAQAVPVIARPSEAMQWLNAHHELSPVTRHALVGGLASHWDEATGDMIVRGVVGWGGRGVRGDTDRIASRILAGILTNILASQYALGLTAVDRPVPAAGRGGLVCAHCGFASGHERAFYCPKCGMRLLRG